MSNVKYILIILILFINNNLKSNQLKKSVVLGSVVNVREKPGLNSKVLFTVKENEVVYILKKTRYKQTIGLTQANWIYIINKDGKKGYIFGLFIFRLENLFKKLWTRGNFALPTIKYFYFKKPNIVIKLFINISAGNDFLKNRTRCDLKYIGKFKRFGRTIILYPKKIIIRYYKNRKAGKWVNYTNKKIYKIFKIEKQLFLSGILSWKKLEITVNFNPSETGYYSVNKNLLLNITD